MTAINLYHMLSDIGDTIGEGIDRRRAQELEDQQRAEASQALGIDVTKPKHEGFLQQLARTVTGEPARQAVVPQVAPNEAPPAAAPMQAQAAQVNLPTLASTPGIVADELTKRGYSPHAIAGILGNMKAESGFNTGIMGDNGTSGGLAQWHNERLAGLKQFAAQNGADWRDARTQAAYTDYELRNKEPRAYSALQAAKTPQEAAQAFLGFERPKGWSAANPMGAMGAQQRVNNAVQIAGELPASTAANMANYSTAREAEVPAELRSFPRALQTVPGIMKAMQNPYMKPLATLAMNAYMKSQERDAEQYTTLTTPEQRAAHGIPEGDTGIWQVDRKGRLVQAGSHGSKNDYDTRLKDGQRAGLQGEELQNYALTGNLTKKDSFEIRSLNADKLGLDGEERKQYLANGKLPTASEKAPTGEQANAATFATRMLKANEIISDPAVFSAGLGAEGAARDAASGLPIIGNAIAGYGQKGAAYQKYDQAKRDFVNAVLRKESGAAISASEFANAEKQYFPRVGDSPEVIAQKAENRKTAMDAIANAAAPSFKEQFFGTKTPNIIGENAPSKTEKLNPVPPAVLGEARFAVAKGADRELVIKRLREKGFDASGL